MRLKSLIRSTIIVLLLTVSINLQSQVLISLMFGGMLNSDNVKFGLEGGANFSTLSNTEGAKFMPDFNLGFYFDIKLKKNTNWYIHTGVLVKSDLGAQDLPVYSTGDPYLDSVFTGGNIERQLKYFNVPGLIRYKFNNQLFVEAGVVLSLLHTARDIYYNSVHSNDDLSYKTNVIDQYRRLDAGVEAGMGYHLMKGTGMNFGIRYYQGLMDIVKDNPSKPVWNESIYLYLCIPIGAGEKAKAKNAERAKKKQQKQQEKKK